jgi:antitoxin CcdA
MVRPGERDYTWLMKAAVNSDLLKKAHELGIPPSTSREGASAEEISKRERWLEENRDAIETYNELVTRRGVFSDGLRGF